MPSAIPDLLRRHRWTLAVGLPVVLLSFVLPLPPLPLESSRYLAAAGLAISSLSFAAAWALWRREPIPWRRLPWVIVAAIASDVFFDGFMRWKAWMPHVAPFTWDSRLADASAFLHGGYPLWRWLAPALGSPSALRFLDAAYYAWFPVMAAGIIYQAWRRDREAAARFALAWVLTWSVLGLALAYAFSSVGPIFLHALTGDSRFLALTALSAGLPLTSHATAADLWRWHQDMGATSIAAFPSMHVAVPVLLAVSTRGWLRVAFASFAVLIFLGSVMLAWHYAIDGYAAMLGVLALWWLAGIVTSLPRRSAPGSRRTAYSDSSMSP